ncbi:tetratricopeptide repeat protein [Chitinophaga horti]|uniref:Tetratricopeptide repeat protein n=1 Tax=Chitinophaga horti TaxID=2920382 RepID=A0ABY6IYH5_9BACT|nr:tetratricopeptide repeat protein [Chitinophaga horti]UYQ92335.1 tetratricopeptide repeat protein [Chitinophaga horti]
MQWQKAVRIWILIIAGALPFTQASAQDATELHNTARNFMRSGDYANAVLVLNQAIQQEPDNYALRKDLAFAYYLRNDFNRGKGIVDPLLDKKDADAQVYQIAGNIYQARGDFGGAEKIYKKGLKKFPKSGELYNDFGELLMNLKNVDMAIKHWVKGIEMDPNFPGNYYHAATSLYYAKDPTWTILYGETFVNLESYTTRTAEVRNLLVDSYKKLFDDPAIFNNIPEDVPSKSSKKKDEKSDLDFATAFRKTMAKHVSVVMTGIEPEGLVMLRTRFLLDWYNFYSLKYPYALFDFQRKLLREGLFEAYNQWIFGPVSNQSDYKAWTSSHKQEYDAFAQYQRNNPLKLRGDEFYTDASKLGMGK